MGKYFKDASIVKIFLLFDMIGTNESKLISNPIPAFNHEFDVSFYPYDLNAYVRQAVIFFLTMKNIKT